MPTLVTESTPRPARIHFGRRLRYWRRAAGLTQAELGRRMAYDHSFISRVERGSRWPTRELAHRCDALLGASGELVDLWRQADLERQSNNRPTADPATVADLATLLAEPGAGTPPVDPVAPEPRVHRATVAADRTAKPRTSANAEVNGADDPSEGHLRQVVRWLEHAPGPVLRRLATLVSGRPQAEPPIGESG